jgi:AraC-like DNA-binding protein
MTLKLDRMQIAQLILDSQLPSLNSKGASSQRAGCAFQAPMRRHRTIDQSAARTGVHPGASPLVQKEIVFRLLTTECGPKIRQIATGGSHIHQISRVIDWIKGNLSERLRVEDLAGRAGMSVSTLHHHFRSLTALSPLQFEKHLRLNEARRLMLIDRVDAATAAIQVGCESTSQFSREYSGGTRPSGGRGVEKRNGRKVPRVHGQRALRQGVIFRCFLPATQALES